MRSRSLILEPLPFTTQPCVLNGGHYGKRCGALSERPASAEIVSKRSAGISELMIDWERGEERNGEGTVRIEIDVEGRPPKKDGANSMWRQPAERQRLKALRLARIVQ